MLKINSYIIAFFAVVSLSSLASASDCGPLNDAMKKAYDNANKMAYEEIIKPIMTKPDLSSLESCLGGLSGAFDIFTLPGIPNLNDLLNKVCEGVVDAVYDKAMDGIGDDLKNMDMAIYRTNDPDFKIQEVDVNMKEPDIDLQKSIDNIFN